MELTIEEVADATNGIIYGERDVIITGVSIDTRTLQNGDLFIPLVAERDGHAFVTEALEKNANAYLFSHGEPQHTSVKVEDTLKALQVIAKMSRKKITGEVIAITGSVGKTTTKDIAASILSSTNSIVVSKLSHNNEIGVPLTLLGCNEKVKHVVLEMGARGPGQIKELCEIASPTIGVVTKVSAAHTEIFKDEEEIALTKGELIESLPPSGTAILNYDDKRVHAMSSRTKADVLTFGFANAVISAANVVVNENFCCSFRLSTPWGESDVTLNIPGRHNIHNALAAVSIGLALGIEQNQLVRSLSEIKMSPLRMDINHLEDGTIVINDSYNANPASMNAAIDTLMTSSRKNKTAVLGIMAELGERSIQEHLAIGKKLEESGINVISIGIKEYGGLLVSTLDDALDALYENNLTGEDSIVLIKGSRVTGLEQLFYDLEKRATK